ncbi:MAG: cyclic nucleotide-binding domain-containing protein [Spirochaetales bacterium]|nr:cyclic nucleotide-binding domain-containing protein [Spirochaetales bacterium]
MSAELINFLKKEPLFSSLNDEALQLVVDQMRPVHLAEGELLCREGEPGDRMYLVASGEIRVLKRGGDRVDVEIAVLKSGELAGMMSLLRRDPRSATMIASGAVELWEITSDTFHKLLAEHAGFAQHLIAELSKYLRVQAARVADLQSSTRDPRLHLAVFDSKPYMEEILRKQNADRFALKFFEAKLTPETVSLAAGNQAVCVFVNDRLNEDVIVGLKQSGVELIALRCAGFNNVDLAACRRYGLSVVRVPAYSPYAVAEHSVALMLALNRHTHQAYNRIRDGNFSLNNLVGFDMFGKTVGVIGAGKIGRCAVDILLGFGCRVLIYNRSSVPELAAKGAVFVDLDTLYREADIISLYVPLTPETRHLIGQESLRKMKRGVMLINTSRGALVDTQALIKGLVEGHIGSAGLDVYEEEGQYFFEDYSASIVTDDVLARLMTFNNVLITSHMAFLTREALTNIADTTLDNVQEWLEGKRGKGLTNGVELP